jgi:hypothetical protein
MSSVVIVEARPPEMAEKSSHGGKVDDLHASSVAEHRRHSIGHSFQKIKRSLDQVAHHLITHGENPSGDQVFA